MSMAYSTRTKCNPPRESAHVPSPIRRHPLSAALLPPRFIPLIFLRGEPFFTQFLSKRLHVLHVQREERFQAQCRANLEENTLCWNLI